MHVVATLFITLMSVFAQIAGATPTPVSVSPSSGSGAAQTFTFVFTDPNGANKITYTQIDINAALVVPGSCYIFFSPPASELFLENDAGTTWGSPVTIGAAGTLQNSQCTVNAGNSSFLINGTSLTLSVAISFQSAYAGSKNIYMEVDDGQDSGWVQEGTWTVPASGGADFSIGVTPSSQTVSPGGGTSYTVTATSLNSFSGSVSLSASGLPTGATAGFSPISLNLSSNGQASSTLSVTTTSGVQTGTFNLSAKGTSGSLNHSATASLIVSAAPTNFTVSVSSAQTMAPGDTTSYAVSVASVNGFSGTVSLTASGLGSGETAVFTPTSVSVPANGSASSTLTITSASNAQLGTFSPSVKGTSGSSNNSGATSLTISTSSTPASQLSTFVACVASTSTATYCALPTLPTGSYYSVLQSQPIVVGHSGVTVTGGGTTGQTILVRDPGLTSPMMKVDANAPLNGVTIQNFTFCGNGNVPAYKGLPAQVAGSGCPPLVATTCGANMEDNTTRGRNKQANNGTSACNDLEIDNVDTGTNPPTPFDVQNPSTSVYSGPFSLVVSQCDFEDSTGNAISMFATGSKKINDVWIHDTAVNYSAVTGIVIDANQENDRKICDTWAQSHSYSWANDPSISLPRNIRIDGTVNGTTSSSSFNNNLTGAQGGSGRWIAFRNTVFNNNYINPQDFNFSGGTLEFDACADTIQIYNNQLNGPRPAQPNVLPGLELRGRNIFVEGNSISGYPYSGVGASSVYNLTIGNNQITGNAVSFSTGGVQVETSFPTGPCGEIPRDTQTVVIGDPAGKNTVTGQPYGIFLNDAGDLSGIWGRNTINGLTITPDNNLGSGVPVGSAPIVAVSGYSSPPDPSLQSGPGYSDTPRALSIDSVSPVIGKCAYQCPTCSSPGSDAEFFTFQAADLGGQTNVLSLAGVFSVGGSDIDGTGGPSTLSGTMPVCSFVYYPAQNVIYLDGPDGNSNWAGGSSVIGANGVDLTNYDANSQLPKSCIIHSAASSVTKEKNILDLTLDVQFLNDKSKIYNKHMYEFVENKGSQGSYGGTWLYWGYWVTP